MTTYTIPETNLDYVTRLVARLNARARRLGQPEISFSQVSYADRTMKDPNGGFDYIIRFYTFEMTGEAPGLNGWTFVAALDHTEDGNIIRVLPNQTLPDSYRNAGNSCDHCHTSRSRISTYVMEKQGQYVQLGSNCLKDFTGYPDPHAIAKMAEFYSELEASCREAENFDFDRRGSSRNMIGLPGFLAAVVAQVENHGFVGRTKAQEEGRPATVDLVIDWMNHSIYAPKIEVTEAHEKKAEIIIEWAANLDAGASDYLWTLNVIARAGAFDLKKHAGYAASMVAAYNREQDRAARQANPQGEYVGEEGKRIDFQNLTCTKATPFDGLYGTGCVNTFQDPQGNTLVWFSSSLLNSFDPGQIVSGKATVKSHEIYNGSKQTYITRPKFVVVGQVEEAAA